MNETAKERKVRLARELRHKRRAEAGLPPVAVKGLPEVTIPKSKKRPAKPHIAFDKSVFTPVKEQARKGAAAAKKARMAPASKPDAPMVVISFRDTPANKAKFIKLGGTEWGRKVLKAAKL